MFIWFGKKGFMRGPVWFLFFIGSILLLLAEVAAFVTLALGMYGSNGATDWIGAVIWSVLAVLYIIAYIVLPKRIKQNADKKQK